MTKNTFVAVVCGFGLVVGLGSCGGDDSSNNILNTTDLSDSEITTLMGSLSTAMSEANQGVSPTRKAIPRVIATKAQVINLNGSYSCPVAGHITWLGDVTYTVNAEAQTWSVYGLVTFHVSDETNNLNDCEVVKDLVILDGALTFTISGNNAEGLGASLTGTIEVNKRGTAGGLVPRGSCFINLTIPRGGSKVTGSVCGQSVS